MLLFESLGWEECYFWKGSSSSINIFTYNSLGGINHTEIPIFGGHYLGSNFQAGSQNKIHHYDPFVFHKHLKLQTGLLNSLLEAKGPAQRGSLWAAGEGCEPSSWSQCSDSHFSKLATDLSSLLSCWPRMEAWDLAKKMPKVMRQFWEFDLLVHFASQQKPGVDPSGPYTWPKHGLTEANIFATRFLKSAVWLKGVQIHSS